MSEHPAALILDLRALADPRGVSVPTWTTARHHGAAMDPPVQVMVCAAADSAVALRLTRMGATRYMPVISTMAQAHAAAAEWLPLTGRLQVRLAPEPSAARVARAVISDVCSAWNLGDLRDRGRLVASELVSNAVEHAATQLTLTLSRRGQGLHLVVRDGDPRLPRIHPLDDPTCEVRGRGLHTVHATATAWGAMPSRTGGKVVWATIWSWRRFPAEDPVGAVDFPAESGPALGFRGRLRPGRG
ncbi:ATP-binding protein [Actinoplanes sp. TFC3]|uniref:ATP-binding protein n=1 Tax=Actinoplanes sp. TFC3 TaxID=1710355 RepID=UPI00137A7FED|nr:ATP-binding protein [Actinoplanes sp. TFC3]